MTEPREPISERNASDLREAIIREAVMRANAVVTADVRVILTTLREIQADIRSLIVYAEAPKDGIYVGTGPAPGRTLYEQFEGVKAFRNVPVELHRQPAAHVGIVSDPDAKRGMTLAEAVAAGKRIRRKVWLGSVFIHLFMSDPHVRTLTVEDAIATDWETVE